MKTRTALLATLVVLFACASAQAVNVISTNLGGASSNALGYPARNECGGEGQQAHNYALVDGVVPVNNWNFVNFGTNIWNGHGNSGPDAGVIDSNGAAVGGGFNTYFWGDNASFGIVGVGPRNPADPHQPWVSGSIFGNGGVSENRGDRVYAQLNNIPYAKYDLYVYTTGLNYNPDPEPERVRVTGQAQVQYMPDIAAMTAGTFVQATNGGSGNYVKFSEMTTPSITITCEDGGWRSGNFAGWQVVEWIPPTGDLRINKWNDVDGDGEWLLDGDQLLGGWTFSVSDISPTLTDNGPLDEDSTPGTILLTGLPAGQQYQIMELPQANWTATHGLLVATVIGGQTVLADWANHYTPPSGVPEPAGLGLIGLALLAVRKRRS